MKPPLKMKMRMGIRDFPPAPVVRIGDTYPAGRMFDNTLARSDYTGNWILARRSSDNATKGFGFLASGEPNTASMVGWAEDDGATAVYAQKWYNQGTAAGEDFVETTLINQPTIWTAAGGVKRDANGNVALDFDGVWNRMEVEFASLVSMPGTLFMTAHGGPGGTIIDGIDVTNRQRISFDGDVNISAESGGIYHVGTPSGVILYAVKWKSPATLVVNDDTPVVGSIGTSGINGITLCDLYSAGTGNTAQPVSSLYYYDSDQSANFEAIRAMIKTAKGV